MTVAMLAACYGCIKDLPVEFYHDPIIQDNRGRTVAMIAILYKNIKDLPVEF